MLGTKALILDVDGIDSHFFENVPEFSFLFFLVCRINHLSFD